MREILFRGKRLHDNKWIYGNFVSDCEGNPHIIEPSFFHEDGHHLQYEDNTDTPVFIIPETVGQYTGLTDKNGKKIFEGDIIICKKEICGNFIDSCVEIGFVEMKHGAFGLHRKQGYYRPFKDWLEDYEYEVIGNIHDNPELLEGGTEK